MSKVYCVVIEHDRDPDFSWLEQDFYNPRHPSYEPTYRTAADMRRKRNPIDGDWYRDPTNHVALAMVAYDIDGKVVDSLGGIDFLADSDEWRTGTVYCLKHLKPHSYLRSLAKEMGLRANDTERATPSRRKRKMTYSNPRRRAEIDNWPMGRDKRGTAVFEIETHPKRGERGVRTTSMNGTINKPKTLTYARKARIVDGDDGRTYIAELSMYGFVAIMRSDMQLQHEIIYTTDPRHPAVLALFFDNDGA